MGVFLPPNNNNLRTRFFGGRFAPFLAGRVGHFLVSTLAGDDD